MFQFSETFLRDDAAQALLVYSALSQVANTPAGTPLGSIDAKATGSQPELSTLVVDLLLVVQLAPISS